MATATASSSVTPVGRTRPGAAKLSYPPLTLADVILAIQDVVGPGDDRLVVATMRHLLRSGRITRLGAGPGCHPGSARSRAGHTASLSSV